MKRLVEKASKEDSTVRILYYTSTSAQSRIVRGAGAWDGVMTW